MNNQFRSNLHKVSYKNKKSDIINYLSDSYPSLAVSTIQLVVKTILKLMARTLIRGNSIELRGFGVFKVNFRNSLIVKNPKTGEKFKIEPRYVIHFKPGKALNVKINCPKLS